jgi:hypothetical protein
MSENASSPLFKLGGKFLGILEKCFFSLFFDEKNVTDFAAKTKFGKSQKFFSHTEKDYHRVFAKWTFLKCPKWKSHGVSQNKIFYINFLDVENEILNTWSLHFC